MTIEDFQAVLAAARIGDDWAVAELWRDLDHRLVRFLATKVGDAAEDVASETWMSVARNIASFEGGETEFRAWVFTIARRRAVDHHRRRAVRPVSGAGDEVLLSIAGTDDPAADAEAAEGTEAALRLLKELPKDQAEAISLRIISGLDVAQVAEIMGKRPGTVRMLQHRGLAKLRDLVVAADGGVTQ